MVDLSVCKFIKEEMWYYTYYDFCNSRKLIKSLYKIFSDNEKLLYKWYVYANIHMDMAYKNAIWDYLNDFDENGTELIRLVRFYKAK